MNISFISTARYPTEKAYGVTIEESCAAANRLGHISNIVTIGEDGFDNSGNQIRGINTKILNLLRFVVSRRKSSTFTKVAFSFSSIALALRLRKVATSTDNLILWARDILLVYVLQLMKYQGIVVLEIHHVPRGVNAKLLQRISNSNLVLITTLTRAHKIALQQTLKNERIAICPMAVPTSFFIDSSEKKSSGELVIGYIGKATSSGQDNGLEQLFPLIKKLSETNIKFIFQFVGLESSAVSRFTKEIERLAIPSNLVSFLGNVPHSEILKYLRKMDIGFVPYPESPYNQARFPIKIPEYAAARCAIFATDTTTHREILDDSLATFYSPEDPSSLLSEVLCFIASDPKFAHKTAAAATWAEDFTYERRISDVLKALEIDG